MLDGVPIADRKILELKKEEKIDIYMY